YIITNNEERRQAFEDFARIQGFNALNTMGNLALEAAYKHGDEWLDELMNVLEDHKRYVMDTFNKYAPELTVVDAEGTYLLWIDCSQLNMSADEIHDFMIKKAKVGLNPGIDYGEAGAQFMRMNIACPRTTLEQGVQQIVQAIQDIR